jgi:hypothetical protein
LPARSHLWWLLAGKVSSRKVRRGTVIFTSLNMDAGKYHFN